MIYDLAAVAAGHEEFRLRMSLRDAYTRSEMLLLLLFRSLTFGF